jgi:O-antigen/teichoic acid export membrane protein
MGHRLTVRRRARRGSETLILTAIHAGLFLVLTEVLPVVALGLFAGAMGTIAALGRLAVFGADREVTHLLRRLEMRRGREQLVLAGQAAVLRFSALLLGFGVLAAAAFEIFGGPVGASSIAISIALGAVGSALFDYGTAPRPGHLGHPSATTQRIAMPLSRLALTVGLCVLIPGRADLALLAYAGATLIFGLPPFMSTERKLGQLSDSGLVARLVKRTRWQGLEDAAGLLSMHAGTLLLIALDRTEEAALFAVALVLAQLFRAALHPLERSLRQRAARQLRGLSTTRVLARLLTWAAAGVGIALLGIPAFVAAGWWLPQLLRPAYSGMAVPLWLLGGTAAILVVETPALIAARAVGRPQLGAFARLGRLALVVVLALWWIPASGATGAALALLTGSAVSLVLSFTLAAALGRFEPRRALRPSPVAATSRTPLRRETSSRS